MEWDIGLQKNPDLDLEVDQIQIQINPKVGDQNLEEEVEKVEKVELQEVDLLQGDELQGELHQKNKKIFKNNNQIL
jgi:uncharacterized protein with ACT and thioredoxin-like domain